MLIAPSVLSADPTALGSEVAAVANADLIHFDVMDGHFVPPLTFGAGVIARLAQVTELPIDVHLMVSNPDERVGDYLSLGARFVTFHWEAATHAHRIADQIRSAGAKVGVALNPSTPVWALEEIADLLDLILVMTVDPGYGGQPIMPTAAAKVARVRAWCDDQRIDPLIEVDGGVAPDTIAALATAGANVFVAGTSVFGAKDRAAAVEDLRAGAQEGRARFLEGTWKPRESTRTSDRA